MTDVHNKKTRSYNMRRIRAKNTKPKLLVEFFLNFIQKMHILNMFKKQNNEQSFTYYKRKYT